MYVFTIINFSVYYRNKSKRSKKRLDNSTLCWMSFKQQDKEKNSYNFGNVTETHDKSFGLVRERYGNTRSVITPRQKPNN